MNSCKSIEIFAVKARNFYAMVSSHYDEKATDYNQKSVGRSMKRTKAPQNQRPREQRKTNYGVANPYRSSPNFFFVRSLNLVHHESFKRSVPAK